MHLPVHNRNQLLLVLAGAVCGQDHLNQCGQQLALTFDEFLQLGCDGEEVLVLFFIELLLDKGLQIYGYRHLFVVYIYSFGELDWKGTI